MLLGLGACVLGLLAFGLSDRPALWLVLEDPPEPTDAAVVLGGDSDYDRTAAAAALVRSGQARLLLFTGDDRGASSVWACREKAIAMGVPREAIRLEASARNTRESVLAVLRMLRREGAGSVTLVTSPFHQRRAFLASRKAWPGLVIRNRPARAPRWSPHTWWRDRWTRNRVVLEHVKLAYYALRGWI